MATVAQKSFFAHLFDESGVLGKVDGELVFFADSGDITTVEPSMLNFLTVLGESSVADTQRIMDQLHGGAAAICTSRRQEVA
jgi:hypothetical protein